MKGDFTRETFNKKKHFSRVLMQQGRVLLDADFNEQSAILLHYIRTLAADLFGPYMSFYGEFELNKHKDGDYNPKDNNEHFVLSEGHCYVDGMLVENEKAYIVPAPKPIHDPCLFYLDVWEHHVTPIEDDSIREKALGGPDTSTRTKVVWNVRAHEWKGGFTKDKFDDFVKTLYPKRRSFLSGRVDPGHKNKNPCVTPPSSKYRGTENQFYRIEIHDHGKAGKATFKWSRDNGSVATAWLGSVGNDLHVANARGFTSGIWVEISDEQHESDRKPGQLVKLVKVESGTLSVDPNKQPRLWTEHLIHPKVRRWDTANTADGTVLIQDYLSGDGWIDLEDGIQVRFEPEGEYRSGDWWWFVARVATGQIEWPDGSDPTETTRQPFGIDHHYAPLALITGGYEPQNLMREIASK